MTRPERWTRWLAALLPERIAAAPERVAINTVCVLVGFAVLWSSNGPWPAAFMSGWALTMIGGGLAALIGYWINPSPGSGANSFERVGWLAILIAALPYGVSLIAIFGWRGVPVGLVFVAIAVAKAVRLLISSAARDHVLRVSREQAGADE